MKLFGRSRYLPLFDDGDEAGQLAKVKLRIDLDLPDHAGSIEAAELEMMPSGRSRRWLRQRDIDVPYGMIGKSYGSGHPGVETSAR
jgi:hypothetical protein